MLNDLTTWCQDILVEWQPALVDILLGLTAFLAGQFLGRRVARSLAERGFDEALNFAERTSRTRQDVEREFGAAAMVGYLVRASVWTVAAWWLFQKHGQLDLAASLSLVLRRAWGVALIVISTLALGSLLARRLAECLQAASNAPSTKSVDSSLLRSAGAVIGVVAYSVCGLVVLLIAADTFDWPLTRESAAGLWQLLQRLLTSAAALFIACLGARYARDLAIPQAAPSPQEQTGRMTATGIVAGTTVLAVTMLLLTSGMAIVLAVFAVVFAVLLAGAWWLRGSFPDLLAGLQLRLHRGRQVWFDGVAWEIYQVGLVATEVCRQGQFTRYANRDVLQASARPQSAPVAAR
jgi:hypothetical protein